MARELEEILQEVNALFTRAEAKPPYKIELLPKPQKQIVDYSGNPNLRDGSQAEISTPELMATVEARILEDPNVLIGAIRDKDDRNLIQPWSNSTSLFAGFRGNFNLLTQAPVLLREILELYIEPKPEPEPIPEYVEPPVPSVKLKKIARKEPETATED